MKQTSPFDRFIHWVNSSITVKLIVVGFLILILLIPVAMVRDLISERNRTQQEVEYQIASEWGDPQTVRGPMLVLPVETTNLIKFSNSEEVTEQIVTTFHYILPEELHISSEIQPKTLKKDVFDVLVYEANVSVNGSFKIPELNFDDPERSKVVWDDAQLVCYISDLRSVRDELKISIDKQRHKFEPGTGNGLTVGAGVHTRVNLSDSSEIVRFDTDIALQGSRTLCFAPWGKTTEVETFSPWDAPKFSGNFLPDERDYGNGKGFSAKWKILEINRPIPQHFTGEMNLLSNYDFGVELFEEVNDYSAAERAAKYAILFIALTFMAFFFIQVMNGVRIHGIQFIMVGLALCIFYVLLLSLSEFIGFASAYLIAGASVVTLISGYVKAISRRWKVSCIIAGMLTALYTFIYVIIQLADMALLAGSIGLFAILAVMMFLTRKIDWTRLAANPQPTI